MLSANKKFGLGLFGALLIFITLGVVAYINMDNDVKAGNESLLEPYYGADEYINQKIGNLKILTAYNKNQLSRRRFSHRIEALLKS